jgi:hypothetical protein
MIAIRKWFDRLIAWLVPPSHHIIVSQPELSPIDTPKPVTKPKERRKRQSVAETSYGVFWNLEDLLNRKDEYFRYLAKLRRKCPEAYKTYSKLGGQIMPAKMQIATELGPEWRSPDFKRPAFGMTSFFRDKDDDEASAKVGENVIHPKLEFFTKSKDLSRVQPIGGRGDIYEVTMFYAMKKDDKFSGFLSFHVHVDENAKVTPLKHWEETFRTVVPKKKAGKFRQGKSFKIVCHGWKYPSALEFVYGCYKRKPDENFKTDTIEEFAAALFHAVASGYQYSGGGVRVNLYQNGLSGVVNVETTRTPYFFKNRNRVITKNGKTARIFHAVMPHERDLKDGRTTFVHYHFRGLRRFHWKGAEVLITVPGKHHDEIREFDVPAADISKFKPGEPAVWMEDIGKRFGDYIRKELTLQEAFKGIPEHTPVPLESLDEPQEKQERIA